MWLEWYYSVYQIPEGPTDEIINNDEELDSWMENRKNKAKQEEMNNRLAANKSKHQGGSRQVHKLI